MIELRERDGGLTEGPVSRHYLHCPHCHGYKRLESNECSSCGAEAVAVLWTAPKRDLSPELVMVERRR